jgi:hypothetical protein
MGHLLRFIVHRGVLAPRFLKCLPYYYVVNAAFVRATSRNRRRRVATIENNVPADVYLAVS